MKFPIQISYRNVDGSAWIEELVNNEAEKLGHWSSVISRCRVVIDKPHQHHHKGSPYIVNVYLSAPGKEIIVNKESKVCSNETPAKDIHSAVKAAFEASRRQIEEFVRERNPGARKHDNSPDQSFATVTKLFPDEGYGFLQTADGSEVYFHRNAVSGLLFERLNVGTKVSYASEPGVEGLHATYLTVV